MVPLMSLLVPIVLSAVLVFIASSVIHMFLPYHRTDYGRLPNEDAVAAVLRDVPAGDYALPYAGSMERMKEPDYQERMKAGPIAFMTVIPRGGNLMGSSLAWWFVYCLVVSQFAAYIASRAVGAGAPYMEVFRFTSATAFIGYAVALWQHNIWYRQKVSTSVKNTIDGLIYAVLTAGVFGWLWPS